MNELITKLKTAGIADEQYITLDEMQMVDIETFTAMFADANTYDALIAADDNGDGTNKGYTRFFDAWNSAGIIT